MKIFCHFGWHKFSRWNKEQTGIVKRTCLSCGVSDSCSDPCRVGLHDFDKWSEPELRGTLKWSMEQTRTCKICGYADLNILSN